MLQLLTPFEYKFASGGEAGEFEGYASVYGNQDSHGDVVEPGAFADSLAERKAQGRSVPMHVMHTRSFLGTPIGVFKDISEDTKGMHVRGRISGATNTDAGKLLFEKVKDGALPGLSIGWSKRPGGIKYGEKAGEPKRRLKSINLHEISLVDDPSNALTVVSSVKATPGDVDKAAGSVAAAMRMHDRVMKGGGYYGGSSKDQALMMDHLRDAHEALTGSRAPDGMEGWTKAINLDALEATMRERFGLSEDEAKAFAARALQDRHQVDAAPAIGSAAKAVQDSFAGFSLPK